MGKKQIIVRWVLGILAIALIVGSFFGGYFYAKREKSVNGYTFIFDHAQLVWTENITEEEKKEALEGSSEEEVINSLQSKYGGSIIKFGKESASIKYPNSNSIDGEYSINSEGTIIIWLSDTDYSVYRYIDGDLIYRYSDQPNLGVDTSKCDIEFVFKK